MSALTDVVAQVGWADHEAATQAHDALVTRPDLGRLADLVEWLAGAQGQFPVRELSRTRLIIVAADHPLTSGPDLDSAETARRLIAIAAGDAPVCELATHSGTGIETSAIDRDSSVAAAIARGVELADAAADAGIDVIVVGNIGLDSTTMGATVISVLTATEPVKVVGRSLGRIDDELWMRRVALVRDARRAAWPHRGDAEALLTNLNCRDVALIVGLLLGAASRHTPVILDGVVAAAAALVANLAKPSARRWWQIAGLTGDPAQALAVQALDLEPILDLAVATGDGSGGLITLGVLRAALALTGTSTDV